MALPLETETRIESHRRQFLASECRGPMLRLEDLAPNELALVNSEFLARCNGKAEGK